MADEKKEKAAKGGGKGDAGAKGGDGAAKGGEKAPKEARAPKAAKTPKAAKGASEPGAVSSGRPTAPKDRPRLAKFYDQTVRPALIEKFKYSSAMQAPRFVKIVLNMGVGDALTDGKLMDAAANELGQITGQRPAVRRAKKAISNFKLRAGVPVGCMVTLRGARMYEFYDRFIHVALPRIRDFRGINPRSFDGRGNYSVGLTEQIIFPEINYDKVGKVRGMDVTIVTTAHTDEEGRELLRLMEMPFRVR
jgi:large subunit ribosomal protein L5